MGIDTTATATELLQRGLRIGEPTTAGNLTLFPVFHEWPAAGYLLYQQAAEQGLVEVTEVGEGGSVPHLLVTNTAELPVLLIEGEVLVGMQQTRTLNITVLAPPKTKLVVPVSCVEQGRWARTTAYATKDDYHLAPNVRASKTASVQDSARWRDEFGSDQRAVWRNVAATLESHDVASYTGSYADVNKTRRPRIEAVLEELAPQAGQAGVLAVVGGSVAALDVFDDPATLTALWQGLVGSYVADALVADDRTADIADAQAWLDDLTSGTATEHAGVGIGTVVEVSGSRSVGSALVTDDTVVHFAAFPAEHVREPEDLLV